MNHDHRHQPDGGNGIKSKAKWVFIGFIAIAAYFLITEHKAHLSGLLNYWPYLLLLACPLLHLFMHGGHGGHGGHGSHRNDGDAQSDKTSRGKRP
jgi:hypothetical protein